MATAPRMKTEAFHPLGEEVRETCPCSWVTLARVAVTPPLASPLTAPVVPPAVVTGTAPTLAPESVFPLEPVAIITRTLYPRIRGVHRI